MSRLENWSIVQGRWDTEFTAPELRTKHLNGEIHDDTRFSIGLSVTTSKLIELDLNNMTAKTRNTDYKLGKVSEQYKTFCEENGYSLDGRKENENE